MFWTDAWKINASLWESGIALGQTALASRSVLEQRGRTIDSALRDPLGADHAELGRMVPEKIAAFGEAGASLLRDWIDLQSDLLAQGRDMATLSTSFGVANGVTLGRIAERASRMVVRASGAGGRALAPVHARVTANERRLNRRKRG
jgi:hypothetical protein